MEQEQIDTRMLNTGTVPVGDKLDKLPSVANGASKSLPKIGGSQDKIVHLVLTNLPFQQSKTNPQHKRKRKTKKPNWQN